jgi:GNAT superfamily N-acetyltransferase
MTIQLRPVEAADTPFLIDVYHGTREDELKLTEWDDQQKRAFVEMQFRAQDEHYRANYTDTSYLVILVDGQPAGRLYVARWPHEIRIMDIALLRDYQGRGVGTYLINELQAEAAATGRPLSIHVERYNPALQLYARLGFRLVEDRGIYLYLTWSRDTASTVDDAQENTAS